MASHLRHLPAPLRAAGFQEARRLGKLRPIAVELPLPLCEFTSWRVAARNKIISFFIRLAREAAESSNIAREFASVKES